MDLSDEGDSEFDSGVESEPATNSHNRKILKRDGMKGMKVSEYTFAVN